MNLNLYSKWTILWVAGLAIGAFLGWASVSPKFETTSVEPKSWPYGNTLENRTAKIKTWKARIIATNLVPKPQEKNPKNGVPGVSGPNGPNAKPPFPPIVGYAFVNGAPQIHVRMPDKKLLTLKPGDNLPNGWQIQAIDAKVVRARYKDATQEFEVIDYPKTVKTPVKQGQK